MGAVKTNRRMLISPYYRRGALYTTKGVDERANKETERSVQSYVDKTFSVEEKLQYRDINNRRKMAGLPMIRQAKS